ncbi:hypothetical protein ACLB2K_023905 [Fragaria x ananassa]
MYYCLSTLPHFATIRPKPTSLSPHRALPIRAMRAVVQRVASASVEVEGRTVSAIGPGLLVLVGLHESDTVSDAEYICRKVLNMRLFTNESSGRGWDQNVMQRNYEVLLVSQFTLYGTLKGNKPDFHVAMAPDKAKPFYASLVESFRKSYKPDAIKDGVFGAMMKLQCNSTHHPLRTQMVSLKNRDLVGLALIQCILGNTVEFKCGI